MKDNISTLYGALKNKGYTDIGKDETEFRNWLNQEGNVKTLYGALSQQGFDDIGDEQQFTDWVGVKKQPKSDDDSVFEANEERFRNGQPTERVTIQSMIDAHPELGLGEQTVQKPSVKEQYILDNRPDIFGKRNASLMDVPLGNAAESPELSGDKLQARIDVAQRNLQDKEYQKGRTKAQLRRLNQDVSDALGELQERVEVSQIDRFRPANLQSMPVNPVNQELMPEYTALRKAQRLAEESENIINEAEKKGNTNFMAGLARGFWDNLNAEDYTFGADDAAQSAYLYQALDKADRGEQLTKAEETLLDAAVINMATQAYFAQDLGKGYGAGSVTAESIPFMLEMAINPISASGKTSAKMLLKYGLKKFANNKAAKVGARLLGDALAATGMAATTGAGEVLEGTTDRLAKNYDYGVDADGNLYANKKADAMGMGEAFARSFTTRAIENQSEMIFNAFKPIGGFMKGVQDVLPGGVNKFFDMLSHNKVADAYRWLKKSPVFRNYLLKDVHNATQIGGIFEEYAEEVYNNLANFAIGEMSWDDVVSLDKNIDTFLGLAPTQAMFGLLGLGGASAMRYQTRRTLEDLQATMNEQQRKQLEGLLDMGLDAEEVDVRGFIRNVMQNENYTIDNKRDMIKAAFYVAKQKGIDQLTEADVIDKVSAENSLIDSVTDPSTGLYSEIVAKLPDAKEGTIEVPGNVVGWFGEGEKRQPIFVAEGMENTEENRRVLKPGEWDASYVQEMPAEQVKTVNEEMIREEAAQQAENEARWNPNVPEPQEGISFFNGDEEVTIVGTDGNGGLFVAPSEEYRAAQGNEKKVAEVVNRAMQLGAIPTEQYKDAMTAQIEADEKAAQYNKPITNEDSVVRNGKTYTVTGVDADGVQYMDETGTPNKVPTNIWKSWAYDQEQAMNPNSTSGESVGEQVNSEVNTEVNNPETIGENVSQVEAQQPQVEAKQEPTLESVVASLPKTKKGEIDYEAMTPQQQYQYTSLSESPEVALEDLQADIAANEEELVKMKDELGKARGGKRAELRDKVKKLASANEELKAFYESVAPKQEPIAETENTESADPIKYAAEEVAEESKPIVAETEKPKKVRKPKLTGRKKLQKPSEFTDEELRPANGVELAAEQLAAGNIKITVESYKKETGHGEEERKKLGLTPFRSTEKGGMTIEQAAEKLVEEDNANHNGRMFDGDTMAARDAIIELLGMSEKWGDVTNYIKNNRMVERQKREEAEYAEYEAYLMESLHVAPEEYELQKEYDAQNNPFPDVSEEEYFAKFAEKAEEYNNYLNSINNDEGRTDETLGRNDNILSEEQSGDIGGNQRSESGRESEGTGSESLYYSEASQESAPGSEVAPSIEETNVGRMADIEARILEIEGRRNEISDEIADTPSYDLLKIGELRAEEWELEQEQAELEAEYSGLRAMNDESNAISEAEGSGLRFRESAKEEENRRKPLRDRAKQWSDKLGVKVRIMESFGDVVNPYARRAIASGQVVTGWFEESTGEVCIYMPHVNSESEVDATYIHEVVAHKGLRGLLGEKFDSFCDEVWDMMSDADRLKFMSYPGVSHLEGKEKSRAAADEYIAHLAENIDVTESAWSKFAELVKKFLKAIGIEPKMTNADIANTIKKSYQRLLSGENAEGNVSWEGTRFRFIGERGARNLDKAEEATTRLDNLAVAREMETANKDAKAIKMATGWERGADGKWRYEVDDDIDFELRRPRKAELKKAYDEANEKYYKLEMRVPVRTPKNATEEEKQRIKDLRKELAKLRKAMNKAFEAYYDYSADNAKLGDFLGKDNQLFKEYPELADYDISFLRDTSKLSQGLKGSFTSEYKTIWIDDARPKGDIKSSLIHEIQHAIQGIEGFAQGGTPQMFAVAKYHAEDSKDNFKEFINRYGFEDWEKNLPFEELMAYGKQYKGQFGALHRAFIDNAVEDESVKKTLLNELDYVKDTYDKFYQIAGGMDAAYKFKDANEWYRSLSGEVEARNVQQRMGMTDEQRRDTLASETEDVAREDQIFLRNAMEEGQTMFRIAKEPAVDYISQSDEVVDVPRNEVKYTINNIGTELYKVSGDYMRELYKDGVLGRVLRGEYAEIDQIKAKENYDKAKKHLGEYLNELIWMKYQATEAAQDVINDVIRDVEYSLDYYRDLALGKDVWRTKQSPRFRIVEKKKEAIQQEVDKFTAKYNSKEVIVAEVSSMSDEEIEEMFDAPADEVREAMGKNLVGGYDKLSGKIFIFVDNQSLDDLENSLFHENMHGLFHGNRMVNAFDESIKDNTKKLRESLKDNGYRDDEVSEEVFVRVAANALVEADFKNIEKYLPDEYKEEFYNKIKDFGYEREQESNQRGEWKDILPGRRNSGRSDNSENGPNGEEPRSLAGTDGTQGTKRTSPREQAERLSKLFDQVADMGLDGVLGNKEYTRLMVDIYKELPEDVRTSLADDALSHYGGSIAPAVSDYVNKKGKASLWDKIVGFIREALRKVGIDVNLNANDAKYILWRSRKPLDRNNLLDVAEDIDMRYRLKVGEHNASTTNGSVLEQIKQARTEVEKNPTEAQKEAGNFKKGHITLDGYDITLENPKGGTRSGTDKNGKKWSITMNNDYGYIRGTEAVDGDHIDIFLSENPTEGHVFVVDQRNEDGSFDESKVMYGFNSLEEARKAYLSNYEKGWENRIMAITEVSKDEFKRWIDSSHRKTKPFSEYKNIKSNGGGTRFRVDVRNKLDIRDEYEATIKKGSYQAREAVQDNMLSLRRVQELIEKASGKKLRDFENAWMHENRLSSVVQSAIHEMERKYYKPMTESVKKLMAAANLEQEQVADYLMLKHGIERNREMAVRKALTDSEGKIDRDKLNDWYEEKRRIRKDAILDTWRKKQEAMDDAALMFGADMSRDYSGLTSMFDTDDLADCTERAYNEVEALENAHPEETEALGKAIKAMTQNTLDESFGSGLMNKAVYEELSNDMYDYYIPLRGFEETTSDEVYAYMDNDRGAFNAPLVRAKGRSSKSDNPIAYLKSIAESGIMQGERNKMKQTFLNMVTNHPSDLVSVREGVWAIFNPATGEWEAASFPESKVPRNATPADVDAAYQQWEADMEQRAQQDANVRKISEAADVPYRVIGNRMNQHQVIVKRLGKSYTLTINGNPRLAMALNGLTNPNNTSNDGKVSAFVQQKVDALNRTLSAWYTTRNPDFVASNFMRDTFYTNTIVRAKEGNNYANHFHAHYAKLLMPGRMISLFSKYENGTLDLSKPMERDFHEFMMNGGETGYSNLKDLEHIKKQIAKDLKGGRLEDVKGLLDKLDLVNRAVENTARFAAYRTSRQQGRSVARSIFDAKEISVNFNKKGAGGTFFGATGQTTFGNLAAMVGAGGRAMYVFFNAAIQGTTNLLHVMKVNPAGTGAGLAAMFLMGAVLPMLLGGDDEKDYYDLPEHVRRNHLIIPGTGDAWVSIPLPIEYRIMYGMGELLTSWRTGHERGSNIGMKMLSLTGQALPLNFLEEGVDAFMPSALSPLWQVYNNRSWTGLPIYKDNEFNKDNPEYTKAYKNVNRGLYKFTKALYRWTFDEENQEAGINLNPAVIEHIAKGYFGGLVTTLDNVWKTGEMIAGEREFDWRNIPVGNRIFKTGDERTKDKRIQNEYFENVDKLEFMQSRERLLRKTKDGAGVPKADKLEADEDYKILIGSDVYKKYVTDPNGFKAKKKKADKLYRQRKENGDSENIERDYYKALEEANKSVR